MRLNNYNDYEIYPETGQIFSYKTNRFIGTIRPNGYYSVSLIDNNGIPTVFLLHRVIWVAVNGEIPKGMEINHIDENRSNNSISNLSLITHTENINWGTHNNKVANALSIPIVALQSNKLKMYFPSAQAAGRKGFDFSNINKCCKKQRKAAYGYQWKYLDDLLSDWLEEIQDEDMKTEKAA